MDSLFPPHDQLQEQRRALAEETLSYAIYLPPNAGSGGKTLDDSIQCEAQNELNAEFESAQLAKTLISSIVAELAQGYIWHKDAFSLRIESNKGKFPSSRPYLRGETKVGDCLDDEWLIVFLLREITKRIPGSVARVQDNDGEFLLIEAADYIPSWLDPDNSENRVFICNGDLHIIPIAVTAEEKATFPSSLGSRTKSPKLQDALDMIRSDLHVPNMSNGENAKQMVVPTLASSKIQQAAFGPILPDSSEQHFAARKILDQRHYARCQIPVDVARILKARPELVTRACEAFYTRDSLAMAACSRMKKFFPASSGAVGVTTPPKGALRLGKNETHFVTTAVCFTKTCYAQLMGQQFQPPKIWDGVVPPHGNDDTSDPQRVKEAELGMKLTCGFEILCSPEYHGDFGFKSGVEIKADASDRKCIMDYDFPFATDSGWRTFKNNLTARKYFGDEHPNSQGYRRLEEIAESHFLEYRAAQLSEGGDSNTPSRGSVSFNGHGYHPVEEIERILSSVPSGDHVADLVDDRKDDDDSWMEVDLQMLEDMMRARGFGGAAMRETGNASNAGLDMQEMLGRFEEFVQEGEGGIEGAEFLDEQSSSDESEDEDDGEEESTDDEEQSSFSKSKESNGANDQRQECQSPGSEGNDYDDDGDDDDDDDDIFASDYEERQARKQAARSRKVSGGAFVFGSGRSATSRTNGGLNGDRVVDGSDDNDRGEMDKQGLKEYMAALDAELSGTKIGESFEKMTVPSTSKKSASTSASNIVDPSMKSKGKEVKRLPKPPKTEKNLEELVKEYAERSRRGFSRQGPLSASGNHYGYDPSALAFAGDDDDEDDEDEDVGDLENHTARVSAISPDDEIGEEMTEDEADEEVVDIDLNLAKNLLESFKSQGGLPGPGGNILSRLGIVLPRDEGDDESEED
ncbi:hypothetical protein BGZ80_001118 [Entomortierella chlamydospora]|uniref:Regulatory factor sgt1 n=1 Tax=Entomortierella chlamydospora TaxID=101097 RepID=A0A9P6T3F6_9FUNG|nr:hypothetical protein BGZ80_001118 [Entomortierella chlamydospora]